MTVMGGRWFATTQSDPRVVDLFLRHYSSAKGRRDRHALLGAGVTGPGEQLVLLTPSGDAVFAWRVQRHRQDDQRGVCCTIFRNESPVLSSDLIREADDLAFVRWPGLRHFTFVDAGKVRRKRDPGRCFLRAGWQPCGTTGGGLLVFELLPVASEAVAS